MVGITTCELDTKRFGSFQKELKQNGSDPFIRQAPSIFDGPRTSKPSLGAPSLSSLQAAHQLFRNSNSFLASYPMSIRWIFDLDCARFLTEFWCYCDGYCYLVGTLGCDTCPEPAKFHRPELIPHPSRRSKSCRSRRTLNPRVIFVSEFPRWSDLRPARRGTTTTT